MNTNATTETSQIPVVRSVYGVPEVGPAWVFENRADVRLVDIREPFELEGPLGHIEGAANIPFRALPAAARHWELNEPVVLVCRSASRTAHAALYLEQMGFRRVASMAGGMISWNRFGLPTV